MTGDERPVMKWHELSAKSKKQNYQKKPAKRLRNELKKLKQMPAQCQRRPLSHAIILTGYYRCPWGKKVSRFQRYSESQSNIG